MLSARLSDTNNLKHYEGLSVPKAHNPINPALNTVGVQCGETHKKSPESLHSATRAISREKKLTIKEGLYLL